MYLPTDPDLWWHLKTGELIVRHHSVPTTDPFSFTAPGKHWVAHEWLSEVVIYAIESTVGYGANLIVFAMVALAACLLGYRNAVSLGASRILALAFFVWALVLSGPYWFVRPQVFTWFFLMVFVTLILGHRQGRNGLWLLPLLTIVWANLHLGYVFGLLAVGLYAVCSIGESVIGHQPTAWRPVVLVLGGCILASLLTPYPGELLLYPLDYIKPGNVGVSFISEWQSPNFHLAENYPLALAVLYLGAFGVIGRKRDWFLSGLMLVFLVFALQAGRNQPLFALVFLIVAPQIAQERFAGITVRPTEILKSTRITVLVAGVVAICFLAFGLKLATNTPKQLASGPMEVGQEAYPFEGTKLIQERYPDARIFNEYTWGGFLINKLYPQKVFVDGRSDFYGNTILSQYRTISSVRQGWDDLLDQYRVDVIIIRKNSALASALELDSHWSLEMTGDIEAVFVRSDKTKAAIGR